jgi:aminoglycoside phosphotransferase (APT) family kinase protein
MLEQELAQYLAHRLPNARHVTVSNVFRIPGGASRETWSFDAQWWEGDKDVSQGFILRRDPPASLLTTERDIEFQVMEAAHLAGIPVPRMRWLEPEGKWLQRPFFIMERIDGCETSPQVLISDPRFEGARPRVARRFVEVLAAIHSLDWKALGLESFLGPAPSPDQCALREIEKWEQVIERDALEPQPVLRAALCWLRRHLPPPAQRITLVHADYRVGNFLYDQEGKIRGVLDWEMAHLGDPIEDVAWACLQSWCWAGDERVGGIMGREEFLRMYEEATGIMVHPQALHFWELLGNVKLAAIFLTGARSLAEGKTREPILAMVARGNPRLELEIMRLMGV